MNVSIRMMKKLITTICTYLASLALVSADGLPVKDGKLTRPHSVFELSLSQKEEIETLNTVTLTDTQWALGLISFLAVQALFWWSAGPTTLEVVRAADPKLVGFRAFGDDGDRDDQRRRREPFLA